MVKKLKVLDFCPFRIIPPNAGGKKRIYLLNKYSAKENVNFDSIELSSYLYSKDKFKINKGFSINRTPSSIFFIQPLIDLKILSQPVLYSLLKIAKPFYRKFFKGKHDLVQFNFPWFASWYDLVPKDKPIVYHSQNFEYEYWKKYIDNSLFKNYFTGLVKKAEKESLEKCDLAITCCERDAKSYVKEYGVSRDKIVVVPNGYDNLGIKKKTRNERNRLRKKLCVSEKEKLVVFVASNMKHNQKAKDIIINKVVPKTGKNVKFMFVGSICESMNKIKDERVIVAGKVKDVSPYYSAADIALNPVVSGSGSNVKIIECLGAGLDVVTTPFGIRGYEKLSNLVSVGKINEFPKLINKLKKSRVKSNNALKEYSMTQLAKKLKKAYVKAIKNKKTNTK